jgi:hypothetical protein
VVVDPGRSQGAGQGREVNYGKKRGNKIKHAKSAQ